MARKTKLEKTIETVGVCKNRLREVYSECKFYRHSFEKLMKLRSERLLDTEEYRKLPRWAQCEIMGFDDGLNHGLTTYVLEGRWELDGKQYTKGPEREAAFKGRWPEVKYIGMWYPGTMDHYYGGEIW